MTRILSRNIVSSQLVIPVSAISKFSVNVHQGIINPSQLAVFVYDVHTRTQTKGLIIV